MIMLFLGILLFYIASFFFAKKRLLRYLRYFQQEEYSNKRFLSWLIRQRAFDTRCSSICIIAMLSCWVFNDMTFGLWFYSICLLIIASTEENPLITGKITLKLTQRAKKIYFLSLILFSCALLPIPFIFHSYFAFWTSLVILTQLHPCFLSFSKLLLDPNEKKHQKKFLNEAKKILAKVNPFVIGITGSYGKTSTKEFTGAVLQTTLGNTFWPPKSVNTPMGITREIRENLKDYTQYAVIEMGAYAAGSISRLCQLTPPHAAIITCIGKAHLERFGSEDAIYHAKSELAKAVPGDGILICNGDDPGSRRIAKEFPKKVTLLYGFDNTHNDLDCFVSSFKTTANGSLITLVWQNKEYQACIPVFGKTAISNLLATFSLACTLGACPDFVLAVMGSLDPVDNRLQLKKEDSLTYLHDAYNSNPSGFQTALDVMRDLPANRKIIITPGMIELGSSQFFENEKIGKFISSTCDLAFIVGETNQRALINGLKKGGFCDSSIILCGSREIAFSRLKEMKQAGDLILIENDLTDLYEQPHPF